MTTQIDLSKSNFDKICRICLLQYESMQSLFDSGAVELFVECATVQVNFFYLYF